MADNTLLETEPDVGKLPKQSEGKILDLSKLTPYIIAAAAFFDALSIFIPWGQMGNLYWYLPLSIPIGWPAVFMASSAFIWTITLALKLAIFTVLGSLLLALYSRKRTSQVTLIVSIVFSLAAFQVAFAHGEVLYLGFTAAVIGCILKASGLVLRYVEVELVP